MARVKTRRVCLTCLSICAAGMVQHDLVGGALPALVGGTHQVLELCLIVLVMCVTCVCHYVYFIMSLLYFSALS